MLQSEIPQGTPNSPKDWRDIVPSWTWWCVIAGGCLMGNLAGALSQRWQILGYLLSVLLIAVGTIGFCLHHAWRARGESKPTVALALVVVLAIALALQSFFKFARDPRVKFFADETPVPVTQIHPAPEPEQIGQGGKDGDASVIGNSGLTVAAPSEGAGRGPSIGVPILIPAPPSLWLNADGSKRIFVHASPNEIKENFKGHTHDEAKRLIAPYLLKWIALSGIVQDSVTGKDGTLVDFASTEALFSGSALIQVNFDRSWKEQLSLIKKGDVINVVCRISDITEIAMALDSCQMFEKNSDDYGRPNVTR